MLALRCQNRLGQWVQAEHQDLLKQIPARAWKQAWVVTVQPVGRGETALKYLSACVQKTALSAARLNACDDHPVTFPIPTRQNPVRTRAKTRSANIDRSSPPAWMKCQRGS